ncbi:hypothetical protein NYF14_09910 [Sphingobium sp. 10 DY56-G10]|uniref:hypothetical protein n=1 Tax=Sphingomonadales TaxID=204457 RepID=UPI0000D7A602|nr:hypothetical protein [Sphingomonas sp. SKA58]EAT09463.1 hypothetical protein SKA58_04085 [Sphingomonas sp. SKA58]MAM83581.1 hypothetical protein [Acidobacteriota bacterium]|tara:strand:- start:6990 stop:7274 length:285 start_codon:yes stop_codon:yes gene_type:complete
MDVDHVIEPGPGEDLRYLQRRAEEELEMAQRSIVPEATAAHYRLAEAYLDRIEANEVAAASGQSAAEPAAQELAPPATLRTGEAGPSRTDQAAR